MSYEDVTIVAPAKRPRGGTTTGIDPDFVNDCRKNLGAVTDDIPLHSVFAISQANQDRWNVIGRLTDQIRHHKAEIDKIQAIIDGLHAQMRDATASTLLSSFPQEWGALGVSRYRKEYVLAVLTSKLTTLCPELYGVRATEPIVELMQDPDIYSACLDRSDFERFYQRYGVPDCVCDNTELMSKLIHRYPFCLLDDHASIDKAAVDLLDNSAFLHRFLDDHLTKEGWGKRVDHILRKFSHRIRSDEDLMIDVILRLCKNAAEIGCNYASSFLGTTLAGSKPFCLRLAAAVQQLDHLSRLLCPVRFKDLGYPLLGDLDVALAFGRLNGENIAPVLEIVRHGKIWDENAFHVRPPTIFDRQPKKVLSEILSQRELVFNLIGNFDSCTLFQLLPENMREDRDIALCLSQHSTDMLRTMALLRSHDEDFWRRIVRAYKKRFEVFWQHLPQQFRADATIALSIARHATLVDDPLLQELVLVVPAIRSDPGVAHNVVAVFPESRWTAFLHLEGQSPLFEDPKLCASLVRRDRKFYNYLPPDLRRDRSVVEAVLSLSCRVRRLSGLLPHDIQVLYPDLVADYIRNVDYLEARDVARELWTHREVALALIARDTELCPWFLDAFRNDQEILLAVADAEDEPIMFLAFCAPSLLEDKAFMLQAVARNAYLVKHAQPTMYDFDLMMSVFLSGESRDRPKQVVADDEIPARRVAAFSRQVSERVSAFLAFATFLEGTVQSASPSCPLTILNQGTETSRAYKRLIAEYCGVPLGQELCNLKRVLVDLTRWGY